MEETKTKTTALTPEEKAKRYEEWKERRLAELRAECVRVVMSQTTWTEEEAIAQLEQQKYNVQACVRIFMGMPPQKEKTSSYSSTNQGIYSEIRTLMDEASRKYEMKKRQEERIQELQLQRQALLEARNAEKEQITQGNEE